MKKDFVYGFKIVLPLVLICLLVVSMIAAVNAFTAPIIEKNKEQRLNTEIKALFGLSSEEQPETKRLFPDQTALDPTHFKAIYEVYVNNDFIGICADVLGEGAYKGQIEVLVAIDTKGQIVDLSCIAQSETPGKGDVVLNDGFYEEIYVGKTQEQIDKDGPAIVAGSTKTSTALKNAVNHALDAYEAFYGKEG